MAIKLGTHDVSDGISRRDALKGLSSLILGSALPAGSAAAEVPAGDAVPQNAASGGAGSSPRKPNILWITGEGVPLGVLSCYGSRLIKTPNIDRLANEGMRFENGFTTNALCAPSRATLMTGTYSHVNGVTSNPGIPALYGPAVPHFDESQETFPKLLKQHGYQTGMVGKWHLPANPGHCGFDYFIFKNGAGGPYYDPNYLGNSRLGSDVIEKQVREGYGTDIVADLVMKGIKQFTQPFLMMVQFFNDHRPFEPPHKYEHLYDNVRIPEPATFWDDYSQRAAPAREARMQIENMPDFHPSADLTPRQRKQWNYQKFMARFLSTMRAQDDNIGRLLDFLDQNGLAENTIVVYTSDHGFFLGDHGWFDKRFMYEQAMRVPWIIRYPGQVKAGSVRQEFVLDIDNAPTALDLAGFPTSSRMQGKSMLPLLEGRTQPDWRTSMYYHYYEFGPPHWVVPHYGIRTEHQKLISYYTINEWELFDLEKDPDEMENLFDWAGFKVNPAYEQSANNLVAQLAQLREQYKDTLGRPVKLWPTSSYD